MDAEIKTVVLKIRGRVVSPAELTATRFECPAFGDFLANVNRRLNRRAEPVAPPA